MTTRSEKLAEAARLRAKAGELERDAEFSIALGKAEEDVEQHRGDDERVDGIVEDIARDFLDWLVEEHASEPRVTSPSGKCDCFECRFADRVRRLYAMARFESEDGYDECPECGTRWNAPRGAATPVCPKCRDRKKHEHDDDAHGPADLCPDCEGR